MLARRFERAILPQLLVGGCAVVFGACILIGNPRAQPGYVPRPTPPPAPVLNPSSPYTVPQPSYTPLAPAKPSVVPGYVVTSPKSERLPRTAARSHPTVVEKTRSVRRHHRPRSTPVSYSCGYLGCVRTYPWAFPCQYYSTYCYGYYRP
jgi:hypothetical protein